MKRNDIKALATTSAADLQQQLNEAMKNLATLRLTKKTGRLSNPRQLSRLRDDIARLKTVLGKQALAQ